MIEITGSNRVHIQKLFQLTINKLPFTQLIDVLTLSQRKNVYYTHVVLAVAQRRIIKIIEKANVTLLAFYVQIFLFLIYRKYTVYYKLKVFLN